MGDSDEYKLAMRVVIKRQLRDLLQQLHDHGDEIAVMAVNMEESTYGHFGSNYGEWFVSQQKGLLPRFLTFCQDQNKHGNTRPKQDVPSKMRLDSPPSKSATPATGRARGRPGGKKSDSSPKKPAKSLSVTCRTTRSGKRSAPATMASETSSKGSARKMLRVKLEQASSVHSDNDSGDEWNAVDKPPDPDLEIRDGGEVVMGTYDDEDGALSEGEISQKYGDTWGDVYHDDLVRDEAHPTPVKRGRPKLSATKKKKTTRERFRFRTDKEKIPVECDECGKVITGIYNLTMHKNRMHKMVRNAQCKICSKWFYAKANLEGHMLTMHTRQCITCGAFVSETVPWTEGVDRKSRRDVFCSCGALVPISSKNKRRSQLLLNDMSDAEDEVASQPRTKSGTKYACGACGKIFHKRSDCETHSKVHVDVKSYACDVCDNRYQTSGGLNRHMVDTHGILGQVCKICGKNFRDNKTLVIHISRFHSELPVDEPTDSPGEGGMVEGVISNNGGEFVAANNMKITIMQDGHTQA